MSLGGLQARPATRFWTRILEASRQLPHRTFRVKHQGEDAEYGKSNRGTTHTACFPTKHGVLTELSEKSNGKPEQDGILAQHLDQEKSRQIEQLPTRVSISRPGRSDNALLQSPDGSASCIEEQGLKPQVLWQGQSLHAMSADVLPVTLEDRSVEEIGDDPLKWLNMFQAQSIAGDQAGMVKTLRRITDSGHDLPTMGQVANDIWRTLLQVPALHDAIFDYAVKLQRRTTRQSPLIYEGIVADRLHKLEKSVLTWHNQILNSSLRIPPDILTVLAPIAATSTKSLQIFTHLYRDLHQSNSPFYDELVPLLVKKGWIKAATEWDRIMTENDDFPSSKTARQPYMQEFQEKKLEWIARNEVAQNSPTSKSNNLESEKHMSENSRGFFSTLVSEIQVHSRTSESNPLSDELCARLFATKALTTAWLLAFLQAFSLKKIGPLTLREIALRSDSALDFHESIERLRQAGVSTGSSKFARAAVRFARENDGKLLHALIHSDQHPDNFEDESLQNRVLRQLLDTGRQEDVHFQMVLVTMFKQNPEEEYFNLLLRHHIFHKDISKISSVTDRMQAKGIRISTKTLEVAGTCLLRPRRAGSLPGQIAPGYPEHDLRIVSNMMFRGMQSGSVVPTTLWVELFKRYGMGNTFEELAQFCHTTLDTSRASHPLLDRNSSATSHVETKTRNCVAVEALLPPSLRNSDSTSDKRPELNISTKSNVYSFPGLFTEKRIQYIIAWGFKEGFHRLNRIRHAYEQSRKGSGGAFSKPGLKHHMWPLDLAPPSIDETYLLGLKLVQQLFEKGVQVPEPSKIREIVCDRLWMLYGPRKSRRSVNVASKALNPYGILDFLEAVEQVWKGPDLFPAAKRHLELAQRSDSHFNRASSRGDGSLTLNPAKGAFLSPMFSVEELRVRRYLLAVLRLVKPYRGASISRAVQQGDASPAEQSRMAYRWAQRQALRGVRSKAECGPGTELSGSKEPAVNSDRGLTVKWTPRRELGLQRDRMVRLHQKQHN